MAYKSIKLDGERELALKSNAATIIAYHETFHEDLLNDMIKMSQGGLGPTETATTVARMAYIMNRQAQGELEKLGTQDFYEWLSDFGSTELFEIMADVIEVWNDNAKTASKPKNA